MKPEIPRRFRSGGIVPGPMLKPGEIPALLYARRDYCLPEPRGGLPAPDPAATDFTVADLLGADGARLIADLAESVAIEATARGVTLQLIRQFGVTLPLRAFRNRPRPMPRLEALVLAKLEGVAVHLGAP